MGSPEKPHRFENGGTPMKADQSIALHLENISRHYGDLVILDGVDLKLARGEIIALLGPSGSGKSSLLHIAGLLEAPSKGEVHIDGRATSNMSDAERTRLRRDALGFVYQFHHLLPEFTALGNASLPLLIAGVKKAQAEKEAERLLTLMGLADRIHHQPGQLSGGEQQRTAIARALSNKPDILLADEPTGNLDSATGEEILKLFQTLHNDQSMTLVVITHSAEVARCASRQIEVRDGRITSDGRATGEGRG